MFSVRSYAFLFAGVVLMFSVLIVIFEFVGGVSVVRVYIQAGQTYLQ